MLSTIVVVFNLLFLSSVVYSIPTCIIIDTAKNQDNSSLSMPFQNLRMLNQAKTPDFFVQSIPLSYIDLKQSSIPSLIDIDPILGKKSSIERAYQPCPMKLLDEIEEQMVLPFEFRRLRIEQPDHQSKFLDDDEPRETVPDGATAVYERRSDPEGIQYCRTCHEGQWTELAVCQVVRCDAELLRANPRLVTEWGEIKPADGGALYAPASIYAIYAFAFGPHCKQCEANGQWSRYALPELCSGIKFFGYSTATTEVIDETKLTTTTTISTPALLAKRLLKKQ